MTVAPAVLHGGRSDGHRDHVELPAPAMVTVTMCVDCKRRHLHEVLEHDPSTGIEVYMRDVDPATDGTVIYRVWDLDSQAQRLLTELAPAAATLPPVTFAGSMSQRGLRAVLGG